MEKMRMGKLLVCWLLLCGLSLLAGCREEEKGQAGAPREELVYGSTKDIRRSLPLSRRERPQWDMEALARAGFVRCSCDTGLSGRIFVRRDATYNPVPMFALRAYRP